MCKYQYYHHSLTKCVNTSARGLICCWAYKGNEVTIYNPTTSRQSFYLPKIMKTSDNRCCFFFGYDPVENKYKVLYLLRDSGDQACQVFTLGDPTAKQWRTIQGIGSYFASSIVVCIKGVIYFQEKTRRKSYDSHFSSKFKYKLMSFDVRSEKFYHIDDAPKTFVDYYSSFINYQGKLGFVCCKKGMEIWVREDGDKKTQGWSNVFFYEMEGFEEWCFSGVTRGGEIVFVVGLPNDVLYYDPKRNSLRYVDLQGTYSEEIIRMRPIILTTLPDFVENTMRLY